tara:strand:- start:881 stop:1165 length:285 start_codon:yes stop_codon:yes gene_type:complete
MKKDTIVDTNYLQGFNLGYDLAKELNLTSPMFKNLNSDDSHMSAVQAGMAEYSKEIIQRKNKENLQPLNLKSGKVIGNDKDNGKDNGKGLSQSI